ncbi:MAG: TlpA disulfide reductase family protein [Capsulimonadaceae bacterium]|nr:TlpA disulfide reductase family protein [Capsulimonadaceae bacterium]
MPLRIGSEMPAFDGATEWFNGVVDPASLIGQPTVVYFWANSCHICKDNMPTLAIWKKRYAGKIRIVSVHRPRQESDMDIAGVKQAMQKYNIDEPTAIDNTHEVGDRFETGTYWPYYFLFDGEGKMKSRAAGDVGLAQIEKALERLLNEQPAEASR